MSHEPLLEFDAIFIEEHISRYGKRLAVLPFYRAGRQLGCQNTNERNGK